MTSSWPDGKRFAFTIIDDADSQGTEDTRAVYDLLRDVGLRTTKTVWPVRGDLQRGVNPGATCEDSDFLQYVLGLREAGFEIGWHMSTFSTSCRCETLRGLDRFQELFGAYPLTMSNHVGCGENMYWGDARLSGARRTVYNLATRFRNRGRFGGHIVGDPRFWGDLCSQHIRYCRNFTFPVINTLAACPEMPYHDPERPFVNYWYAASEGSNVERFREAIRESEQDSLEEAGGACIMYAHTGFGFARDGVLDPRFRALIERLARKNGWFVPVGTLLDYLLARKESPELSPARRAALERRWLTQKLWSRQIS